MGNEPSRLVRAFLIKQWHTEHSRAYATMFIRSYVRFCASGKPLRDNNFNFPDKIIENNAKRITDSSQYDLHSAAFRRRSEVLLDTLEQLFSTRPESIVSVMEVALWHTIRFQNQYLSPTLLVRQYWADGLTYQVINNDLDLKRSQGDVKGAVAHITSSFRYAFLKQYTGVPTVPVVQPYSPYSPASPSTTLSYGTATALGLNPTLEGQLVRVDKPPSPTSPRAGTRLWDSVNTPSDLVEVMQALVVELTCDECGVYTVVCQRGKNTGSLLAAEGVTDLAIAVSVAAARITVQRGEQ